MSIPVAAAGLVALFGMPPLSSVIAATRGLNDKIQSLNSEDGDSQKSSESQFEDWEADSAPGWSDEGTDASKVAGKSKKKSGDVDDLGFSEFPRDEPEDRPRNDKNRRSGFKKQDEIASLDAPKLSSREKSRDKSTDLKDDKSTSPASMKESLKKLNSLGVKHYHLERGADQDTWLFVCLFSPGDDTRVTHRFEAESEDPEGAVSETLKQIDGWLLKRFRDKQPISQAAM